MSEIDISKEFNNYNIRNLQHWSPLNNIINDNENNNIQIKNIIKRLGHNIFEIKTIKDEVKTIFIKYSGILDYTKYLVGKYSFDNSVLILPNKNNTKVCCKKKDNPYNSAYIDGFFSYLSNKLLKDKKLINGILYYGSFLANQSDYQVNILDDLDYLSNSRIFLKNIDKYFKLDTKLNELLIDKKPRIKIIEDNIELNDIINITEIEECSKSKVINDIYNEKDSDISESENDSDNDDLESITSSEMEEPMHAYINNYPINMICLENLDETLDAYLNMNNIEIKEWKAIFMQIIMTLLVYQNTYEFTHNDLHTNNVMYISTTMPYLYYEYKQKYYKVPTFGKIWKIIDFGRSIYTYNSIRFASDSFFQNEDAYSQYNCEPFFNPKKKKIEPNYSFDLCRLACSLYDYHIDDDNNLEEYNEIQKIIYEWCLDDNNKNILYKKTGEERYPEFKLYKMIARLVHKHTPEAQLNRPIFKEFLTNKKKIKNNDIINCN